MRKQNAVSTREPCFAQPPTHSPLPAREAGTGKTEEVPTLEGRRGGGRGKMQTVSQHTGVSARVGPRNPPPPEVLIMRLPPAPPAPSFIQLTVRCTQEPLTESSSGLCLSRKSTRHSYQPWSSARSPSIRRDAPFCSRTRPGGGAPNPGHAGYSQRSRTRPCHLQSP